MPDTDCQVLKLDSFDSQTEIDSISKLNDEKSRNSVTNETRKFYAFQTEEMKNKIDLIAAEIHQRLNKMRLINDIIAEINNLTDEKNSLDISQNEELLEKLQLARDLGVKIKEGQMKFNDLERDRLMENLHLAAENWNKENHHQTQKLEILHRSSDRIILMLKDVNRKEEQTMRTMIAGQRGAH